MNFHEDYLFFFLLSRNAFNYKKIDRVFHIYLKGWNITDKSIEFRMKEKNKDYQNIRCISLLNFIEFILDKTENTTYDKEIAFFSLDKWFLNYFCRNYSETINKAINISKQYLQNKFIKENDKKKIKIFLNETLKIFH